jgi:phage baseplate assembly protein W
MAIIDKNKRPYIADEDNNVFIGIDLPIRKSDGIEGYFASTSTTIEAVKNNIKNLLHTNKGERLMQPTLGLNLRNYLFEPFTDDLSLQIQNEISETVGFWLPFVEIRELKINMDENYDVGTNTLLVDIVFNIKRDPNTLASLQLQIDGSVLNGGGF